MSFMWQWQIGVEIYMYIKCYLQDANKRSCMNWKLKCGSVKLDWMTTILCCANLTGRNIVLSKSVARQ